MISFATAFKELLHKIVTSKELHAKWINTLSYLENCGARKIAACEHPTQVKEEMLKHAAEEFRHAHYLKQQIKRVSSSPMEDYSCANLLGGIKSLHYLKALDLKTSRFLSQTIGLSSSRIKAVAYLLVTYAIELRAEELYPIYDETLRSQGSKVIVKSILLEEKEHLKEMEEGIEKLTLGLYLAEQVCGFEADLCRKWITSLMQEV